MQLRFTPQGKRQKQLASAEKLFAIIDKDKEYPFEFICFKITGYRLKDRTAQELIKGSDLADDLPIFIARLSSQVAPLASQQQEKVYDIQQLAEALSVSTKTINRWRRRGLLAQKFVFDDGAKRLGFLQSTVDSFIKANPELTAKAGLYKTDKKTKAADYQTGPFALRQTGPFATPNHRKNSSKNRKGTRNHQIHAAELRKAASRQTRLQRIAFSS